jgi:5-methylcytosine-specific restriction enzyme subunit McrC
VFHTVPDVHLEKGDEVILLDTKWKRIDDSLNDFDVSQADAYQMFSYAQTYHSRATVLLFPHNKNVVRPPGIQASLTFEVGGSSLVVATLDIAQTEEAESLLRNIILGSSRKLSNDKPEMGG